MSPSEGAISSVSASAPASPLIRSSLCYEEIIEELIKPLPSHLIEVRPGATTKDKKRAIALAYYDWRIVVNRLNRLVGGRNWQVHLHPWGANKLICTLTILGVPKESSGEGEDADKNGGTSAEQQAKKRAMAEHGLNYLYLLPQVWGDYDLEKKRFVNPEALVEEMYRTARIEGLDLLPFLSSARKAPGRQASTNVWVPPSPAASPPAKTMTSTEPTAEEIPSTPPVDDKLIADIRRLCSALGRAEPVYTTLTSESARRLRGQLFNEAKAGKGRGPVVSAPPRS